MLNKQTFTAIEVCVCIARLQHQTPCSTGLLSRQLGQSVSYLEQILKQLKAHEIVCSFRGPGGGYKILGSAQQVSMWRIARIFEHHADAQEGSLPAYEQGLQQVVEDTLSAYTLADFANTTGWSLPEPPRRHDSTNRFKFKPLAPAWQPKAANSVFQWHLQA